MKKMLLFSLLFCALGLLALDIPFTPVAEIAKDVMVDNAATVTFSQPFAIPNVPAKPGMVIVLKVNCCLATKGVSGWNNFGCLELNGKDIKNNCPNGPRLLYRGTAIRTTHPKDKTVPYWKRQNGHDALFVFFAPPKATVMDARVVDKEFGYDYYFRVDDLLLPQGNSIRFANLLTTNIVKNNVPFAVTSAVIGYIPADKLTLESITEKKKLTAPKAEAKTAGCINAVEINNPVTEKGDIPFTPIYNLCNNITIAAGEVENSSLPIVFPAVPVKKGMSVVLKINQRILTPIPAGWNPYMGTTLNGANVRSITPNCTPRLLGRGPVMHTNYAKESEVPYWREGGRSLLLSIFGPATDELDARITDRKYGYDFYVNLDDLVSKLIVGADDRIENDKPNRIQFTNSLSKKIADYPLFIKYAQIGYVPTAKMSGLLGIKMNKYAPITAPKAVIHGKGFSLKVSQTGGMELVNKNGSIFFESGFSYVKTPVMGFNTFGVATITGQPSSAVSVQSNGNILFKTKDFTVNRLITSQGHYLRVIDKIKNISSKDLGLIWKNCAAYSDVMPTTWRLSGMTGSQSSTKTGAANPTIYMTNGKTAVGLIAEDTISRNVIDLHLEGNQLCLSTKGVGLPSGKGITIEWTIYPLAPNALGYFDFINQVREDWGVNNTIPGPFHFGYSPTANKGLQLRFAFKGAWHNYGPSSATQTDESYVKDVQASAKPLRDTFPGIKILGKVETNLVPFKVTQYPWGNEFPLTKGNRKDPRTKYAQYTTPELGEKLLAVTPYRDSMLKDKKGGVMFDNYYTYNNVETINLMVQPETNNFRYKEFMRQIEVIMDKAGMDGLYIDQFNPTARDGLDYSRWDGYSVELDKAGNIAQKFYNYAITGADGRMRIIKKIIDKGGIAFTNGHPVTREEQNSGRLSFAEMENDPVNPLLCLTTKPAEGVYMAMGHLASPIILNLRPHRYTGMLPAGSPDIRAQLLTKGFITAFRNGNIPYFYTSSIPLTGETAGSFELANQILPFTPVKLGEGVLVGKERTITCLSGDYTMTCKNRPQVTHFNKFGHPTDSTCIKVTGKPGNWKIHVSLSDWNEIAVFINK